MGNLFVTVEPNRVDNILNQTKRRQPLNSKMRSFALISVGLLAMTSAKFCPGEKNGNKCVAGKDSYKCAVFFEDLTSSRPLTWIGALPDALKKARNKAEIAEILGKDVTEESFKDLENCDGTSANARCYTILDRQRKMPLDSCDRNLINTRGSETVGDYLCGQVRRWLRNSDSFKAEGIRDLRLPVYYSACNNEWTPVSDGASGLYVDEPLCCNPDGTFFRCDGSDYRKTC